MVVSHDNLVAGATIVADYLHLASHDRTLAILPWSFDYGLNQVLATFAAGATVVIQRSSFGPDICRTLAGGPGDRPGRRAITVGRPDRAQLAVSSTATADAALHHQLRRPAGTGDDRADPPRTAPSATCISCTG